MNFSLYNEKKLFYIFFILIFFYLKIYFILINPANLGSYTIAVNTLVFFNSKSFYQIAPQAFNDWNHPGTPVYILGYIIGKFLNGLELEKIQIFLNINHIITLIILIFSIIFFLKKTENFIDFRISIAFLLLTFSFDCNFLFLEALDLQAFLIPFILIKLTFILNGISRNKFELKEILIIALINSLLLSIKISTFPLVASSSLYLLINQLTTNKKLNSFYYSSAIFVGFLLFNFPIIGRLPKVIYNIFLVRDDTILNFYEIPFLFEKAFKIISFEDFLLLFIITIVIIISIIYFITNFSDNKNLVFFIIISIFWFIYTLVVTIISTEENWFRGVISRNSYFYLYFILLHKSFWDKTKFYNLKSYFLGICLICFCIKSYFYIENRSEYLNIVENKEKIFTQKIEKYVNKNSKIAIYNNYGYGFADFSLLSSSNDVFSSEAFSEELNKRYDFLRYLRLNKIENNILNKKESILDELSISDLYESIDLFLNKYLPPKIYYIFSHKSYKLTNPNYDKKKNNEFFLEEINEKKLDLILVGFHEIHDKKYLIDFLEEKSGFEKENFNINNDPWIILFKKK